VIILLLVCDGWNHKQEKDEILKGLAKKKRFSHTRIGCLFDGCKVTGFVAEDEPSYMGGIWRNFQSENAWRS
jgi:hypothetical protein